MRAFLFVITFSAVQSSFAQFNNPEQTVYEKLAGVNKEWLKQPITPSLQSHAVFSSDEALIQFHLQQVEARLRNAGTAHLSESQKTNRELCLSYLHEYWQTGRFPKNTHHDIRTPYFIDDFGTYCAVGYLVQQSGHDDFARRIHDENNYAYIHEMNYPELLAWANEFGFTKEELAWIQPAYATAPAYVWTEVEGADIQGVVHTISVDKTNEILYAAADFGNAGNGIMSFDGVNWDDMDGGVDGVVQVILIDRQNVIVGGDFSNAGSIAANNIAIWDGSQWSSLGSGLNGAVKALAIYNDELYAGGDFYFSSVYSSLAKWDGNSWSAVPASPNGTVHALKEYQKELYVGGSFDAVGASAIKNLVKMDEYGFSDMGGYPSTVRALEAFRSIYVTDTTDMLYVGGDIEWDSINGYIALSIWDGSQLQYLSSIFPQWYLPDSVESYISYLRADGERLFVSGLNFQYSPMMWGVYGDNAALLFGDVNDTMIGGLAWGVNGAIKAAVEFKGAVILGGEFDTLSGYAVNKLGATGEIHTSISVPKVTVNIRVIYHESETVIYLDEPKAVNVKFSLWDAMGRQVMSLNNLGDGKVRLCENSLSAGLYLFSFNSTTQKLGSGNIFVR